MQIHSIANFKFQADKLEEVIAELKRLTEVTTKEQGCIQYYYIQNTEDPTHLVANEIWETQEDLQRHIDAVQKSKNKIFFEYLTEAPVITTFSKI